MEVTKEKLILLSFITALLIRTPIYSRRVYEIPAVAEYIIENAACSIPYFSPWSFTDYYENKSYVPCEREAQLVRLETEDDRVYLVFDASTNTTVPQHTSCCISNITRALKEKIPDNNIEESKCEPLESQVNVEITNDVVRVRCYKKQSNQTRRVFEEVFAKYVKSNIKDRKFPAINPKPYNVLIIIIDNVSRGNFARLLKCTSQYLTFKEWTPLKAFNQVGKDDIPNILALLTGYSSRANRRYFGNPKKLFFDNYNFVWYDYQKNGYVTTFAEDYSKLNTFNKDYKGFNKTPTDYYFRHYALASDRLDSTMLDGMPHCTGSENTAERILNLALEFPKTFKNVPHFGIFWMNTFSRNDFNAPARMDAKLAEFLEELESKLEDTIVFFMSDHGFHDDSITDNVIGWFESRQPFAYVRTPDRFKRERKNEYERLKRNSNSLISPYDLYLTLQDILVLSGTKHVAKESMSCKNCSSLFGDLAGVRTCKEAGIDEYWCTCISRNFTLFSPSNETSNYFIEE